MAPRRLPRRLAHGEEVTLVEHLGELRTRLLIALGSLVPAFAFAFAFHRHLVAWLTDALPPGVKLVTLGVTEPFTTSVKISFYAALGLALPVILYQLWSFFAPAIEEGVQRVVSVFVVIATALFAAGVAFGYFVLLGPAVDFLTNFDANLYDVQVRASYYLGFATLLLLAMGVVFELPIFILGLVRLRVVTSSTLRRNRRVGYFLAVLVAVLLPTVDPVSLLFETLPLVVLFEASIWLSVLMERRWNRATDIAWE